MTSVAETGNTTPRPQPGLSRGAEVATVIGTGIVFGALVALFGSGSRNAVLFLLFLGVLPIATMAVGGIRRALMLVIIFDVALEWGFNLHYDTAAANIGALGGLDISITTFALTGLYGLWFMEWLSRPKQTPRIAWRSATPLLVYLLFVALSVGVAAHRSLALFELALLLQSLCVFLYFGSHLRDEAEARFIAVALVACLLLEGAVVIASARGFNINTLGLQTYREVASNGGTTRYGGTIGSPNTAATFFATLLPLAIVFFVMPVSRSLKRLAGVAAAVGIIALVLTLSRGGWLAFLTAMVVIIVAFARRHSEQRGRLFTGLLVVGILSLPFAGIVTDRITQSDQGSAQSRIPLIEISSQVVHHNPILGVGVNNVGMVMRETANLDFGQNWIYTVHNKYLLVWAESGLGALIAFLWFLIATVRRGFRCWRRDGPFMAPFALALAAAVCGQMVQMTVEIFQSRPQVQLLWLIAGVLVAVNRIDVESRRHALTPV
jgi:putative inorganic carbon (HCO3(-)) transporter